MWNPILAPISMLIASWLTSYQPPASPVVVARITEREVASGQDFVATVHPLRTAVIGSAVDGRVVEFMVDEGQRVEDGQELAQLLTGTIELQLKVEQAQLSVHQQELRELENGARPEEIEQVRARMLAAEAREKYAEARRKRTESLFRAGQATSQEELDEAISVAIAAIQVHAEARAEYELIMKGPREEQLAQARAHVAKQQAVVEQLQDQIAKHTLRARFAGYIASEHTEVGAWVKRGDPVVELVALDQVEITAYVVEKHAPYITVGSQVPVQIPALNDRVFSGEVVAIVPQADLRARTFPVKVLVDNFIEAQGPLLKAGMFARVTLPTSQRVQALLVPKDALVLGGAKPVVFVCDRGQGNRGKVRPVPVQLGVADGGWMQIRGDVQVGQWVVVRGNERLRPGQEVAAEAWPTDAGQPGSGQPSSGQPAPGRRKAGEETSARPTAASMLPNGAAVAAGTLPCQLISRKVLPCN